MSSCHPFFRRSPWPTRNLALCGNFNLTNTRETYRSLIAMGQHPIFATDTQAILEKIGFFLDEEHEDIYRFLRKRDLSGADMSRRISEELDVARVLTRASEKWDGGYVLGGPSLATATPLSRVIRRASGRFPISKTTKWSPSPVSARH